MRSCTMAGSASLETLETSEVSQGMSLQVCDSQLDLACYFTGQASDVCFCLFCHYVKEMQK